MAGIRAERALIAILLACSACKGEDGPPDAGLTIGTIEDADVGFFIELGPDWIRAELDRQKTPSTIGDARRRPREGRSYLVAPRLVVSADPTDEKDAQAVIRAAMNDLRALGQRPSVKVERMTMSTRLAGPFEVGDLELAYSVLPPKQGDSAREVVHRSLVTRVTARDGAAKALTITVTYMAEDADLVAPEVQRMLTSLRLAVPEAK